MKADIPSVVFILGGPGSGKGTQSALIQKNLNFLHLSAGDLLRDERKKGSEKGQLIQSYIKEGKIVPSQITVALLEQAMRDKGWEKSKFIIDGFPRNWENYTQWNKLMDKKVNVPFLIFLDCSEQCMAKRLLKRGETSGRLDDNQQSIKKRFVTYRQETMPVIHDFEKQKKCVQVHAEDEINTIFEKLKNQFKERGVA